MTQVDFFGHWFYFFILLGMLYISFKDRVGWVFRFAGEAGWVGIGFVTGLTSIWFWGLVFMAIDLYGFFTWKTEEEKATIAPTEKTHLSLFCTHPKERKCGICTDYLAEYKNGEDKTIKRKSKRKAVATKRSRSSKKKVQPARRRRSKQTNGKRRRGYNDVARSSKKSGR